MIHIFDNASEIQTFIGACSSERSNGNASEWETQRISLFCLTFLFWRKENICRATGFGCLPAVLISARLKKI